MQKKDEIEEKIFFNKFQAIKKIGEGSFGKIYEAVNINTREKLAIKFELKSSSQHLLEGESYILSYLKGVGIPQVKSFGYSLEHNVLVMELLGKSLEDFYKNMTKFSLKTICMMALQFLDRLEFIHQKNFIHRDIKPENFTVGIEDKRNLIYLIDFGLAKRYRDEKTGKHHEFKHNKKLTGTARYASINALNGYEQSRRDDLESIGYLLVYFIKGVLPWQGLKVKKNEDRYKKIYDKKAGTTPEQLCEGLPREFQEYIKYTRGLDFEKDPDYEHMRNLFRKIMKENCYEEDYLYDWISECTEKSSTIENSKIKEIEANDNNLNLNLCYTQKLDNGEFETNEIDELYVKNNDPKKPDQYAELNPLTKKLYDADYKFIEYINSKNGQLTTSFCIVKEKETQNEKSKKCLFI